MSCAAHRIAPPSRFLASRVKFAVQRLGIQGLSLDSSERAPGGGTWLAVCGFGTWLLGSRWHLKAKLCLLSASE
eukprot:3413929-Rhodomonas_salina.2